MEKQVFEYNHRNRKILVEIGELAKQANGACLVRYEDTAVLSAAVGSNQAMATDFFPLTVLYQEKLYAAGKIPGGFLKREGRPTEHETLVSRLIDRPIRPLFAEGYRNEVQVINMVMSANPDCSSAMAAMLGSSIALSISDIPFEGPIAGVVVGRMNGKLIINPTVEELKAWIPRSGLPVKKFFNTSGLVYKELKLSEKLPAMSEEEQIALLATNGKLVKRPLVVTDSFVLVGFKPDEWEKLK